MTWLLVVMPLIALVLILPPLFRPGRDKAADRESELDMLQLKRRSLISAIRELDFDRGLGKLSEEDHVEQRQSMKAEVAKTIKQIENRGGRSVRKKLLALAMLTPFIFAASGATAATLRGEVVNGTGVGFSGPVKVHLVGFGQEGGEWDAPGAKDGFVFENVPGGPDNPLLLQTTYEGVSYNEQFTVGITADTVLTIRVYETTTGPAALEVEEMEIDVRRTGQGSLRFDQVYRVMNVSEPPRTLLGDGSGTFRARLPLDAAALGDLSIAVSRGIVPVRRDPIPTDDPKEVAVDYPLRPGFTAVAASYEVPYTGTFEFKLTTPVEIPQVILVAPSDITVEGSSVTAAHAGGDGGGVYTIGVTPAGGEIAFRVSGGAVAAPAPRETERPHGRVFSGPSPFEDVRTMVVILLLVVLFAGLLIAGRFFTGGTR